MRSRSTALAACGLAAGVILIGGRLVAGAQDGAKRDVAPPAASAGEQDRSAQGTRRGSADAAPQKPLDAAQQKRLRDDLDRLLKQRSQLDQRIAETRARLGERPGVTHHRFQFQNGNGAPQIFEFDGDGIGNLPPEARKQIEEAQKRLQESLGNMHFDNLPSFDFQFDGKVGPDGVPDMKAFRERMQQWRKEFRDRMQRRSNESPAKPGVKPQGGKSDTPAQNGPRVLDA